jgi:hypothetical protein
VVVMLNMMIINWSCSTSGYNPQTTMRHWIKCIRSCVLLTLIIITCSRHIIEGQETKHSTKP